VPSRELKQIGDTHDMGRLTHMYTDKAIDWKSTTLSAAKGNLAEK